MFESASPTLAAQRVTCTIDALGVAQVRLNRPERRNALDGAQFAAILDTLARLRSEPGLRAVVLAGEGQAFCAGIDVASLKQFEQQGQSASVDFGEGQHQGGPKLLPRTHGTPEWPTNAAQEVAVGWRSLPVPVFAALRGVAFGGGLQIALGADVRLAAPDTRLSVMEIQWGLVPDMGGMALLRELLRSDVMRELVLTGRELLAPEALGLGLISRVCTDPLAEATALAHTVAGLNPDAVRAAKRLLNLSLSAAPVPQVLMAEAVEQQAIIGSDNQREAVRARMAGRSPLFR